VQICKTCYNDDVATGKSIPVRDAGSIPLQSSEVFDLIKSFYFRATLIRANLPELHAKWALTPLGEIFSHANIVTKVRLPDNSIGILKVMKPEDAERELFATTILPDLQS